MMDSKYLELLKEKYKNKEEVLSELVNLEAILSLPKGTELFISDIHGEYKSFNHILRTGSGNIKEKVYSLFGDSKSDKDKDFLCLLIAYPEKMLALQLKQLSKANIATWYTHTLMDLLSITRHCSSKYSRSKVRKALPLEYAYIIEELLYSSLAFRNKKAYYKKITDTLIHLEMIHPFIISLSQSIQRFVIDHIHIVGDIFDRGEDADKVMNILLHHHSIDIQWGNHDMLWMGAYAGNKACLATLLRIATRYNYLYNIEESYGLNLRPLFSFADAHYRSNSSFRILQKNDNYCHESNLLLEKVHQALTIIQFKLEGQIIQRRPEFDLHDRLLLDKINSNGTTVTIANKKHTISNPCFQTIDSSNPYTLSEDEQYIMDSILTSFQNSEKLQRHIQLLLDKGSMYSIYNNHLLFHGCIPMNKEESFASLSLQGKTCKGKDLLDAFEKYIRQSTTNINTHDDFETDFIWFSWIGKLSPLYGRENMATFERYFVKDPKTQLEKKNDYYTLREEEHVCQKILHEFGLKGQNSKIINGHTPVKARKGESPVRANGKLLLIDGGLSKVYHNTTGIAGYTLLSDSYSLQVVTHQPFQSFEYLVHNFYKDTLMRRLVDKKLKRKYIKNTTIGKQIQEQCQDLYQLLHHM